LSTTSANIRSGRWLTYLTFVLVFGIALATGYFIVLVRQQQLVIRVLEQPLHVEIKELDGDDPLLYTIDYCKYLDITPLMTRELVALDRRNLIIMLPITAGSLPVGCHKFILSEFLPQNIPPGKYLLRITRVYRTPTLFDDPIVLETEPFYIR